MITATQKTFKTTTAAMHHDYEQEDFLLIRHEDAGKDTPHSAEDRNTTGITAPPPPPHLTSSDRTAAHHNLKSVLVKNNKAACTSNSSRDYDSLSNKADDEATTPDDEEEDGTPEESRRYYNSIVGEEQEEGEEKGYYSKEQVVKKKRVSLSSGRTTGNKEQDESISFFPSERLQRHVVIQQKKLTRHIAAASKNVTRQNVTYFNEDMDPRNSTTPSVVPLPASPSMSSPSSTFVYSSDSSSACKDGQGRRETVLSSQKKQPTTVGNKNKRSTEVSILSNQEMENVHLNNCSAGKILKGSSRFLTKKYYSQEDDTTKKTPKNSSATASDRNDFPTTCSTSAAIRGDFNRNVADSDNSSNKNVAVPYAMPHSTTNRPSFLLDNSGQSSFHHPYMIQSSASSVHVSPAPAAAPFPCSTTNSYYYYSDALPQNSGRAHTNLVFQHPDPRNMEETQAVYGESGVRKVTAASSNGSGVSTTRDHDQQYYTSKNNIVVVPTSHNQDHMSQKQHHQDHLSPITAHMTCFDSHGQPFYYIMPQPAYTNKGPSSSVGYHSIPQMAYSDVVQQQHHRQHHILVSPPAASAMPNIYLATEGGGFVVGVPPMVRHLYPPPQENHHMNQSHLLVQQNYPPENNAYYEHAQHDRRKRNFDDYQQLSSSNGHSNTKMANCHPKQTADKRSSTATTDSTFQKGPTDSATKKRIILAKLEEEKPRRPLTAYNFFFSEERERIIAEMSSKNTNEDNNSTLDSSSLPPSLPPPSSPAGAAQGENGNDNCGINYESKQQGSSTASTSTVNGNALLEEKIRAKTEKLLSSRRQCDRPKRSHKKEHGKVSFQVLCTLVGKRWKSLTAEQKQYYVDLSKVDIERYREDMKDYARKRARAVETCAVDDASKEG
jgi:hypothetical protein